MAELRDDNATNNARRIGRCPRGRLFVNGGSTVAVIATLELIDFDPAVVEAPEFFLTVDDLLPVGSRIDVTGYQRIAARERAFSPTADNVRSPAPVPEKLLVMWQRTLLVIEHELGRNDTLIAMPTAVVSAWDRPATARAKKAA